MFKVFKEPKQIIEKEFINTYKDCTALCLFNTNGYGENEVYSILVIASNDNLKDIREYNQTLKGIKTIIINNATSKGDINTQELIGLKIL